MDHTKVNLIQLKIFNLNLTLRNIYITLTRGLSNVTSATVSLVYINVQPEYEHFSSTRFGQFVKFEKI